MFERLGNDAAESGNGPLDHGLSLGGRADAHGQAVALLERPVAQFFDIVDSGEPADLFRAPEFWDMASALATRA